MLCHRFAQKSADKKKSVFHLRKSAAKKNNITSAGRVRALSFIQVILIGWVLPLLVSDFWLLPCMLRQNLQENDRRYNAAVPR